MKFLAATAIAVLTFLLAPSKLDAVTIATSNGSLYCDDIICPSEATGCQVTKRNDPNDFSKLIKVRRCYGKDGAVLSEQTSTEPNAFNGDVNVNIFSGSIVGRELTPEEQRKLEEELSQIPERINSALSSALGPLLDGSFARNLQNSINRDVQQGLGSLGQWNY